MIVVKGSICRFFCNWWYFSSGKSTPADTISFRLITQSSILLPWSRTAFFKCLRLFLTDLSLASCLSSEMRIVAACVWLRINSTCCGTELAGIIIFTKPVMKQARSKSAISRLFSIKKAILPGLSWPSSASFARPKAYFWTYPPTWSHE